MRDTRSLDEPSPSPARMRELRDIYMTKIQIKNPIVDADHLDAHITHVLENGFEWSTASCLVLLVFALASIWGNYPDDERRIIALDDQPDLHVKRRTTMAIPDDRMRESLIYLNMAQKRLAVAYLDDSLFGVVCFCLFGFVSQNLSPTSSTSADGIIACGISTILNPFLDGKCFERLL